MTDTEAARGLGWASIAIGLTEILAPHQLENAMGIHNGENTGILRTLGVREILHGVDILAHDDPAPGVWARIAGDALDSALLGIAATRTKKPASFATIFSMVLGIGVLDAVVGARLAHRKTTWREKLGL
jgi:hypothetical protein